MIRGKHILVDNATSSKSLIWSLWWTAHTAKLSKLLFFTNHAVIVVVQSLSCVRLFATPWPATCQASLSFTISQSSLKLRSTESVMPSNHFILCHPILLIILKTAIQEKPSPPAIKFSACDLPDQFVILPIKENLLKGIRRMIKFHKIRSFRTGTNGISGRN